MKRLILGFALAVLTLSSAPAQEACPLNYKFFELAIPHLDLPSCPKDIARPGAFCRVTTANDAVHVFVFEEKGRQCLLAVKSYSEYQLNLK